MHFKKQFAFKAKPQEAFYCSLTSVNSVIFYKNKGDRSDNNHQGISLQNILCAEHSVEIANAESHCGLRTVRSTIDILLSLRHLLEKCREQKKLLYVAFCR